MLGVLLVILLLAGVVWLVGAPLRRPTTEAVPDADRAGLEAAKEAKYREIRDAEMDSRTGKLSPEDYRTLDRQLRVEAVEILRQLDELEPPARPPQPASV